MDSREPTGGTLLYKDSNLTVDLERTAVRLDGNLLQLTRKEFDLLVMLVQHAGAVVPREALLSTVWSYEWGTRSRTLDVHVRRSRKHLGRFANWYIETIFGKGYRFQSHPEAAPEESCMQDSRGLGGSASSC